MDLSDQEIGGVLIFEACIINSIGSKWMDTWRL
jgi:hypothetical protein